MQDNLQETSQISAVPQAETPAPIDTQTPGGNTQQIEDQALQQVNAMLNEPTPTASADQMAALSTASNEQNQTPQTFESQPQTPPAATQEFAPAVSQPQEMPANLNVASESQVTAERKEIDKDAVLNQLNNAEAALQAARDLINSGNQISETFAANSVPPSPDNIPVSNQNNELVPHVVPDVTGQGAVPESEQPNIPNNPNPQQS